MKLLCVIFIMLCQSEHSLGIGLEIDIDLSYEKNDSLSLNIYYQNIPMSQPLKELNHGARRVMDKNVHVEGINYYFNFKKPTKQFQSPLL
jgi:hypothetical protein